LTQPSPLADVPTVASPVLVKPKAATEPGWQEVLLLACVCYAIYVGLVMLQDSYGAQIRTFGDNQPYISIANGIRHWDFSSVRAWQFWGLPYAMVVFSFLTRTSLLTALMCLSIGGSLVAVMLSNRLWGGWVAGYFAIASREWMERSLLGGAEPLFLALVFGSFLAARRERWLLAALLAGLSATVRPMGIFALAGVGLVLLYRKNYKTFLAALAIGLSIGIAYALPLRIYLRSPLANVKAYGQADGSGGQAITFPFVALIHDALSGRATKLNLARTALWMGIVLLAVVVMFCNRKLREFARQHPVEIIFGGLYTVLLFTYNSPWARIAFPRYSIPIVPFLVIAFLPWIPKDRRLLWGFGIFSAVLSAVETVGFTEVAAKIHMLL